MAGLDYSCKTVQRTVIAVSRKNGEKKFNFYHPVGIMQGILWELNCSNDVMVEYIVVKRYKELSL